MNANHQFSTRAAWVLALAVILTCASLLAWLFVLLNEPPPQPSPKRELLSREVPRNGTLIVNSAVTSEKKCDAMYARNIFDSSGRRVVSESEWRPTEAAPDPGETSSRSFWIPTYAALGPARYVTNVHWECNFLQRLFPQSEKFPELSFQITNQEKE